MAKATKKSETKVTRITASDSGAKKPAAKTQKATAKTKEVEHKAKTSPKAKDKQDAATDTPRRIRAKNPLAPFWRYLKGAWYELRQVRWPDRRATWKMTGALLAFTLFFVIVILLLDAGFNELFKLIMGK